MREAKTGQLPPTSDEVDALIGCGLMEPKPVFALLPEASAPAGLGTVAWPNNIEESSTLFGRLPSEIAGHRINARFEQSGLGVFSTTYEEPNKAIMAVTVHDLTKGDFFPPDANAGQFVALYAKGADWEVLAAGREGDLAWVQWKTGGLYTMHWGNSPSSIVFQAMANDLMLLMALVEAMVSAASGGSAAPSATVVVSATSDVVTLTRRVEDALALASQGNWLEAWEYYTLSFRESCPKETFAAQVVSGMNMFRSMLEIPPDESLEFRLMDVTVIGSTALVSTHIFHQGEPLDYGAQDELDSWVRIDGEWWNNVPPGPEGCVN
ncbi:MAG: hypothetical protein J4N85_06925 [Chloroflexi bacterium]|nr:hypothetical protein [Chloroflexota bacterium]